MSDGYAKTESKKVQKYGKSTTVVTTVTVEKQGQVASQTVKEYVQSAERSAHNAGQGVASAADKVARTAVDDVHSLFDSIKWLLEMAAEKINQLIESCKKDDGFTMSVMGAALTVAAINAHKLK